MPFFITIGKNEKLFHNFLESRLLFVFLELGVLLGFLLVGGVEFHCLCEVLVDFILILGAGGEDSGQIVGFGFIQKCAHALHVSHMFRSFRIRPCGRILFADIIRDAPPVVNELNNKER